MKHQTWLAALATVLMLFSFNSLAEQAYIEVSGSGEVKALPDIANVQFSFSQQGLEQNQAKKLIDTQVINLLKLAEKLGVKKADLFAARLTIYPEYDYKQNRRLTGYRVSRNVSIILRELENYPELIDGAVKIGATQTGQLSHDFSNRSALEDQAMLKALQQAKNKASLLARDAGAKLGAVIMINESGQHTIPQPVARFQVAQSQQAPYPTGELTIIKNLVVRYAIEQ